MSSGGGSFGRENIYMWCFWDEFLSTSAQNPSLINCGSKPCSEKQSSGGHVSHGMIVVTSHCLNK